MLLPCLSDFLPPCLTMWKTFALHPSAASILMFNHDCALLLWSNILGALEEIQNYITYKVFYDKCSDVFVNEQQKYLTNNRGASWALNFSF